MSRIRMFIAAVVAAFGLLTVMHTPAANAIIVHAEVLEGVDPSSPPPPPEKGDLLSLCLTIRAAASTNCISI